MRKKELAAKVLTSVKAHKPIRWMRKSFRSLVPILAYHRVMDLPPDYPFDSDLISATVEEFEFQMRYLKKYYDPISMKELIELMQGKDIKKKHPVMVTFDDGFLDNYSNAFPILKELDIPATFFVTTDFIDHQDILWYEKLAYFIKKTSLPNFTIERLSLRLEITSYQGSRQHIYTQVVEQLKQLNNDVREKILLELFQQEPKVLEYMFADKALSMPMSWDQIREMQQSGMDVGSHSLSHPVLSNIDLTTLRHELSQSKQRLEKELGVPIRSIAYPVGQTESISETVERETRKAGYEIGFSYIDEVNRSNLFSVSRIHIEYGMPRSFFICKLMLPEVFCEA